MAEFTEQHTADELTREELEVLAETDGSWVSEFLAEYSRFDSHRVRVLLDLGTVEARRRLEAL